MPIFAVCSKLKLCNSLSQLLQIHAQMITAGLAHNTFCATNLIAFCALSDHGNIDYAHSLFRQVQRPNLFTYNTMIQSSAWSSRPENSVILYTQMRREGISPDHFTYPFVLKACGRLGDLQLAGAVHGALTKAALESNSFISSSIITMYANCGSLDSARHLFDKTLNPSVVSCNALMSGFLKSGDLNSAKCLFLGMPGRDLVSWSTLIAGCVQFGDSKKAIELFAEMQTLGVRVDGITLASLLSACAHLGAFNQGKWLHAYIYRSNVKQDVVLCTSLIDMYSKCGGIEISLAIFLSMVKRDILSWNAIINGLAVNGHGERSVQIFQEMQREGQIPDGVTFIGVLCACSHAGLLDEGLKYYESMTRIYKIKPREEHYGCMVDLFGRAGNLVDAVDFIRKLPIKPNAAIWGALLSGCFIHGNAVLGEHVGKLLIELEPHHSGRYVLLSNLYANASRWNDARNIREMMRGRRVDKIPGQSKIEVKGVIHEFFMGDRSHPQAMDIYCKLDEIMKRLVLAGYKPETSNVLFNLDEEEKENILGFHSEKLAIAFGLINLGPNMPIRIVKNLRVCVDCHSATKLISKIYNRKIIVRDRNRFHHFEGGCCSCKDYW